MRALTMPSYLKFAFGTNSSNTIHLESTQGNRLTETQIRNALSGNQVIYALIPVDPSSSGFKALDTLIY